MFKYSAGFSPGKPPAVSKLNKLKNGDGAFPTQSPNKKSDKNIKPQTITKKHKTPKT